MTSIHMILAIDESAAAIRADHTSGVMVNLQIHFGMSQRTAAAITGRVVRLHFHHFKACTAFRIGMLIGDAHTRWISES